MSRQLEKVIGQEGIKLFQPQSILDINPPIQRAAIDLFRFLPELNDPRWSIARQWSNARNLGIKGIHEEASQIALYLGNTPSFRNGFCAFHSEENIRHICRAAVNLSQKPEIQQRFNNLTLQPKHPDIHTNLNITNRITLGKNPDGVTGCPEALYQIQLRKNRQYLGRIGFNIHQEDNSTYVSITNIQGVPQAQKIYAEIKSSENCDPFVFLINQVRQMFPDSVIRGLKNPKVHPEFYNTVLKSAGIKRINRFSHHFN